MYKSEKSVFKSFLKEVIGMQFYYAFVKIPDKCH